MPEAVKFDSYDDEGVQETKVDPYGDPLHYVLAGQIAKLKIDLETSKWNKAVLKFIGALPPETPIVLWWH